MNPKTRVPENPTEPSAPSAAVHNAATPAEPAPGTPSSGRRRKYKPQSQEENELILTALLKSATCKPDLTPVFAEVAKELEKAGFPGWDRITVRKLFLKLQTNGIWEQMIAPEREARRNRIIAEIYQRYMNLQTQALDILSNKELLAEKMRKAQPDKIAEFLEHVKTAIDQYGGFSPEQYIKHKSELPNVNVIVKVSDVEKKRLEIEQKEITDLEANTTDAPTE